MVHTSADRGMRERGDADTVHGHSRIFQQLLPRITPAPLLGAFSGNPVWNDKIHAHSASIASSAVRAVAGENEESPHLSHNGAGAWVPGYATDATSAVHNPFETDKWWFVTGLYECANTPARRLTMRLRAHLQATVYLLRSAVTTRCSGSNPI